MGRADLGDLGLEHGEDRQSFVDAIDGAGDAVGLVAVNDPRRRGIEGEAAVGQPVDGRGCVLRDHLDDVVARRPAADPRDVGPVFGG